MQLCSARSADLSWHFTWWSVVTHAHVLHALALTALALAALALLVPCFPLDSSPLPPLLPIFTLFTALFSCFCCCRAYAQCAQSINATDLRCVMSADGGHMSRLIFPLIVTTLSLVLTNTASTKFELFSFQCINNEKYFFFRLKMKKIQKFSEGWHGCMAWIWSMN